MRSVVINQAITGMGGLGKTQLAVEFAYRYGKYFQGVHWLNLADPTSLDAEIAFCGSKMGFANFPDDQPSQVTMTELEWKRNGLRLLILDNFEDVSRSGIAFARLHHSNIRLLITSRRSDWSPTSGLSALALGLFSPVESLAFLKNSLRERKDSDNDLATLAERLGHLPLGLELASRYLNDHPRLKIAEYLEQAQQALEHPSMNAWHKDMLGLTPTQHDTSLLSTFALSWQAVKDEIAQKIFQTAGYLAPNTAIPLEIFEKALEISTEVCDENLSILYGLGLLRESENNQPAIHPLLAEYARGLAKENKEILESLADALGNLTFDALTSGMPANFYVLSNHTRVAALYSEKAKLESAGMLWGHYGSHLDMIADYFGAHAAHEHALKIDEANFGPEHPKVAIRVNNLGLVMQAFGDLPGARAAFERALKIDEANFGHDHPNVAYDINNLGLVMKALGDLPGAHGAYERALKIFKQFLPLDHPNIKTVQRNLDSLENK